MNDAKYIVRVATDTYMDHDSPLRGRFPKELLVKSWTVETYIHIDVPGSELLDYYSYKDALRLSRWVVGKTLTHQIYKDNALYHEKDMYIERAEIVPYTRKSIPRLSCGCPAHNIIHSPGLLRNMRSARHVPQPKTSRGTTSEKKKP